MWKPGDANIACISISGVSEGLNSVETLVFLHHLGTLYEVSEGLNSVETLISQPIQTSKHVVSEGLNSVETVN